MHDASIHAFLDRLTSAINHSKLVETPMVQQSEVEYVSSQAEPFRAFVRGSRFTIIGDFAIIELSQSKADIASQFGSNPWQPPRCEKCP